MILANFSFTEADLASHVLRMCPHQWQDQYNLQEKGMTPMEMRTLLASLEAIEPYVPTRKPLCHLERKLLIKERQEPSGPILELHCGFPKKSASRSLVSYARNMGARILRMLPKIAASMRKTER
jgi:hypothetical protein